MRDRAVGDSILHEQIRYYRERAAEYDVSILGDDVAADDSQVQEFRTLPQLISRLAFTRFGGSPYGMRNEVTGRKG